MIKIKQSKTADSRNCDFSKVSKETLIESSEQHVNDVREGLLFFNRMLSQSGGIHDYDKFTKIDHFHSDFITGFKEREWWINHQKINRHHLQKPEGVPGNVNLIDVLEMITDCVMAGMARNLDGFYPPEIDPKVLMDAFNNTIKLLQSQVEVEDN